MKKRVIKVLLAVSIAMSVVSCSVSSNVYKTAPFTDVDKLMMLKSGMEVEQVKNTLGIDPYDVYHVTEDNSLLLTFCYRLKERRYKVKTFNQDEIERKTTNEESQTNGDLRYDKKHPKVAYILFTNGKMVSMLTTEGRNTSELIMIKSNNLTLIDKDDITDYDVIETIEITPSESGQSIIKNRRNK